MSNWTHIALFDRPYPADKQAEGVAISQAIVGGHCDKCGFFAQCMKRKAEILKKWED